MKHLFKGTRLGWAEEKKGIWFDSDVYSEEEARAEFHECQGTTQKG